MAPSSQELEPPANPGRFIITKDDQQFYDKVLNKDAKVFRFWRRMTGSIVAGVFSSFVAGLILSYFGLGQ
jgi:hypothetical protein